MVTFLALLASTSLMSPAWMMLMLLPAMTRPASRLPPAAVSTTLPWALAPPLCRSMFLPLTMTLPPMATIIPASRTVWPAAPMLTDPEALMAPAVMLWPTSVKVTLCPAPSALRVAEPKLMEPLVALTVRLAFLATMVPLPPMLPFGDLRVTALALTPPTRRLPLLALKLALPPAVMLPLVVLMDLALTVTPPLTALTVP